VFIRIPVTGARYSIPKQAFVFLAESAATAANGSTAAKLR
jgi:hypothetical protein